jgi:hypothetical protein
MSLSSGRQAVHARPAVHCLRRDRREQRSLWLMVIRGARGSDGRPGACRGGTRREVATRHLSMVRLCASVRCVRMQPTTVEGSRRTSARSLSRRSAATLVLTASRSTRFVSTSTHGCASSRCCERPGSASVAPWWRSPTWTPFRRSARRGTWTLPRCERGPLPTGPALQTKCSRAVACTFQLASNIPGEISGPFHAQLPSEAALRLDRVEELLVPEVTAAHPEATGRFDFSRLEGLAYYAGLMYRVRLEGPPGALPVLIASAAGPTGDATLRSDEQAEWLLSGRFSSRTRKLRRGGGAAGAPPRTATPYDGLATCASTYPARNGLRRWASLARRVGAPRCRSPARSAASWRDRRRLASGRRYGSRRRPRQAAARSRPGATCAWFRAATSDTPPSAFPRQTGRRKRVRYASAARSWCVRR